MSNFPLIRYKDIQNWIPETDIDGTDAPNNIISSIKNFDYRNGYIETSGSLESVSLPSNVQTQIDNGYNLLSFIYFTHSTQGLTSFAVLWKITATATEKMKFYVNNTLISPDTQNNNVSYSSAPSNINYNIVNDQLKINLNTTATYTALSTSVILNFTLIYFADVVRYSTVDDVKYGVGWYLFPRWLGWSYGSSGITLGSDTSLVENCADGSYESWFSLLRNFTLGAGFIYAGNTGVTADEGTFLISGVYAINKISFDISSALPYIAQINYFVRNAGDGTIYLSGTVDNLGYTEVRNIVLDLHLRFDAVTTLTVGFELPASVGADYLRVDNIKVYAYDGVVVVAKYTDGQRGLIQQNSILDMFTSTDIVIPLSRIDWRVISYEIYDKAVPDSNIYYLIAEALVNDSWSTPTTNVSKTLVYWTEEEIEQGNQKTLNANYNLPADTRVDNQRNIYSEISHKNRVYFVNGDYKVYQGHISANLVIQADAFPYDEETGFGYFEVSHERTNIGLAVTPTNDLAIFTNNGTYVYFIESSSAGAFKRLTMLTGSVGLVSLNSLAKSNSGDPKVDGLFWCDENGIYYYGGGINPPTNLLIGSHEKYWRDSISLSNKQNSVGAYYPKLNEYWLVVGSIIIAFELPYKAFKTYELSGSVSAFPLVSNSLLYCQIGNALYSYTFTTRSAAEIISHYNVGYNPESGAESKVAEIEDKILQEIYIVFGICDTVTVTMYVYVDDILLGSRLFTTSNRYEKWLMDYGIRFGRIKLKIVTTSGLVRIKEFGCSFVPDFKEQLGNIII